MAEQRKEKKNNLLFGGGARSRLWRKKKQRGSYRRVDEDWINLITEEEIALWMEADEVSRESGPERAREEQSRPKEERLVNAPVQKASAPVAAAEKQPVQKAKAIAPAVEKKPEQKAKAPVAAAEKKPEPKAAAPVAASEKKPEQKSGAPTVAAEKKPESKAKAPVAAAEKKPESKVSAPAAASEKKTEQKAKTPVAASEKKPEPKVKASVAAPEKAAVLVSPPAETVIQIDDVSMRFKINEINAGSLKEYLVATVKRRNKYHELQALQHISFDVARGEVLGIIGTNGSGKSTLLKLIAGVLSPSEGRITVDRKKVQFLALGVGFDVELTARENVYLNGAIIGYSKEFIDGHFEKIVQFAELDGFMDEKIKNFSSGMTSRLGFAIATAGDTPEILILDEVLSVGDMFFRKKSEQKIREMIHSGSTVLIVSHSTDTIIKNCTKAVWIEKGVMRQIGEPKKVCEAYRKQAQG